MSAQDQQLLRESIDNKTPFVNPDGTENTELLDATNRVFADILKAFQTKQTGGTLLRRRRTRRDRTRPLRRTFRRR